MITLINQKQSTRQTVIPTMFPDGTSQVWKLDLAQIDGAVKIVWDFEQEAELIWLNQLVALLNAEHVVIDELLIPYLPYARQDKPIANNATFAKSVFLNMLDKTNIGKISTIDAHSPHAEITSYSASRYIKQALQQFHPNVLVFPDGGAYARYQHDVNRDAYLIITLDKVRNQSTGEITGLTIDVNHTSPELQIKPHHKAFKCLIIDDICDGGATFNNAAVYLHAHYDCKIALYVTHGIFSKGFTQMIESGISAFYTTQSLKKNIDGFAISSLQDI